MDGVYHASIFESGHPGKKKRAPTKGQPKGTQTALVAANEKKKGGKKEQKKQEQEKTRTKRQKMLGDDCRRATGHLERRQNATAREQKRITHTKKNKIMNDFRVMTDFSWVPTVIKPPSFYSSTAAVAPQPQGPTENTRDKKKGGGARSIEKESAPHP